MKELFKSKNTLKIAEKLVGSLLCKRSGKKIIKLPITETEAYDGPHDLASHARFGKTTRNSPMFKEGGIWYVYFVYGNYWMLNIVTGPKDYPAGVLIRGAGDIKGPGRLTRFLKIDKSYLGKKCDKKTGLWIEITNVKHKIKFTPRIGVNYAGEKWAKKPYRVVKLIK